MRRWKHFTLASSVPAISIFTFAACFAYPGEQLAKNAKITMKEATKIALKARPGRLISEELERERGGSGLRYSFDIKSHRTTYEVGVDAQTGKILENDKEGPDAH